MEAQSSNNARIIAQLYQQSENILLFYNNKPNTLHVAAALGLPSFVREIVDNSPEQALNFDEHGLTPYHLAVANGHISVIKELLDSKVGIDLCCLRDKCGFLPIHVAVIKGRINVLKAVNDTCPMQMLQELTPQGDTILHLALRFDSLEAFRYLWHFLSGDMKLLNRVDAEGNTLLHLAIARRQQEIVEILVGKVDLNVVNLNGSTAHDILFNLGQRHKDMTLEKMFGRANRRTPVVQASQPENTRQSDQLHSGEFRAQPFSPEADTNILFYLQENLFDFGRALTSNDKDREISNTLMVVATLIATITFQSALNPPGGFIADGEDRGMAVLENYIAWYLFFDIMAFVSSLSVILLTIYVVPIWKDMVKLAMFITWVSVLCTFMSFQSAIGHIYANVFRHPLIEAFMFIGDGIVLVFALLMFFYTWHLFHQSMATFFHARSTKGIKGISKIVVISCIAFLGAALLWLPIVMFDIIRYGGFV